VQAFRKGLSEIFAQAFFQKAWFSQEQTESCFLYFLYVALMCMTRMIEAISQLGSRIAPTAKSIVTCN